jgi:hypothetical protein
MGALPQDRVPDRRRASRCSWLFAAVSDAGGLAMGSVPMSTALPIVPRKRCHVGTPPLESMISGRRSRPARGR